MKKLREYKGVTFEDGKYRYCGAHGRSAASLIYGFPSTFTDDDHAALMDLKANPYEPTPTLEQIIEAAADHAYLAGCGLARDWEGTHALSLNTADAIRSAFPQIDTPYTAADHIAANKSDKAKLRAAEIDVANQRDRAETFIDIAESRGKELDTLRARLAAAERVVREWRKWADDVASGHPDAPLASLDHEVRSVIENKYGIRAALATLTTTDDKPCL